MTDSLPSFTPADYGADRLDRGGNVVIRRGNQDPPKWRWVVLMPDGPHIGTTIAETGTTAGKPAWLGSAEAAIAARAAYLHGENVQVVKHGLQDQPMTGLTDCAEMVKQDAAMVESDQKRSLDVPADQQVNVDDAIAEAVQRFGTNRYTGDIVPGRDGLRVAFLDAALAVHADVWMHMVPPFGQDDQWLCILKSDVEKTIAYLLDEWNRAWSDWWAADAREAGEKVEAAAAALAHERKALADCREHLRYDVDNNAALRAKQCANVAAALEKAARSDNALPHQVAACGDLSDQVNAAGRLLGKAIDEAESELTVQPEGVSALQAAQRRLRGTNRDLDHILATDLEVLDRGMALVDAIRKADDEAYRKAQAAQAAQDSITALKGNLDSYYADDEEAKAAALRRLWHRPGADRPTIGAVAKAEGITLL